MRRARRLAAVAAVALVLAACAPASDPDWVPATWDPARVSATTSPAPLDPVRSGVMGWRLRSDDVGVQARVGLVGAVGFDTEVLAVVRAAIAERSAATGVAYRPQVFPRGAGLGDRGCVPGSTGRPAAAILADPALGPAGGAGTAVVCDLVAATGSVFGERLRVVSGTPDAVVADATRIFYTDVATGVTADATGLWTAEAAPVLWQALVDGLRREAGALSRAPIAPADAAGDAALAAALATTVPAAGGALVVTLPAGFTAAELSALGAPPTPAPLPVAVPAALAAGLTTPIGAALVAAAVAGAPFAAPAPPLGAQRVDCGLFPCVAVTYDDGPGPRTPAILDAYAGRPAAATFFAMGASAAASGDLLRRMVAAGHEVADHSWNHPRLPMLDADAVKRQIAGTAAALEAQTGVPVTMFRPPYGEYNARVLAAAGLPAILWDVDTLDWQDPPDEVLVARAVDEPRPGSIVLQHDVQPSTARTVDAVLDGLLDRGFVPVTVTQLFGGQVPASGAWRSAR